MLHQLTDWKTWEFYHYLVAAGIVVTVLALILYFIPGFRIKMPAIVISCLGCLAAGVGAGMLTMVGVGYHLEQPRESVDDAPGMAKGGMGGGEKGGGAKGRGGMPGGRGGMMGGRGPSSKTQLAGLVDKLDVLTSKPLAIELTPEKKTKIAETLKGLDDKAELSEDDAKAKLDVLANVLKDDKATLEAAGYRFPGEGGGGRGAAPPANPFKEGDGAKHLKALEARLSKDK